MLIRLVVCACVCVFVCECVCGEGGQRCELRADRAASRNSVYHIRHGNIASIFFSLPHQSLYNPSKQQWNNSLFALCGLGPQDPLCCCSQCSVKVETIFSLIVKINLPQQPSQLFCASLLSNCKVALHTSIHETLQ